MRSLGLSACLLSLVVASACGNQQPPASSSGPAAPPSTAAPAQTPATPPPPIQRTEATPEAIKAAGERLQRLAQIQRKMRAALTFEEFEETVYREPFEGGKYIVDGDTPIASRKLLMEFYEKRVKPPQLTGLTLATQAGMDVKWNQQDKSKLTYCVSTAFGSRHANVVQQMEGATAEWEKVASVDFTHNAAQDATCGPTNQAVVFDVRPVNVGDYLARAFFPDEPRAARNVLIDESSFQLAPPPEKLQLAGILRHELGHTLGFRHEHTRPESGTCFEDSNWRPLTSYDAFSVMHYPQCNGRGDWSLILTPRDKNASACLYGPAAGFTVDPTLVSPGVTCAANPTGPVPGTPVTKTFDGQAVAQGAQKPYGPFPVAPGSLVEVAIGGPGAAGDPDLYVRFDTAPTTTVYQCRPYLDGPVESCALTVPAKSTRVFVMVRGYAAGKYGLTVKHVPPTP